LGLAVINTAIELNLFWPCCWSGRGHYRAVRKVRSSAREREGKILPFVLFRRSEKAASSANRLITATGSSWHKKNINNSLYFRRRPRVESSRGGGAVGRHAQTVQAASTVARGGREKGKREAATHVRGRSFVDKGACTRWHALASQRRVSGTIALRLFFLAALTLL
jgi:hypothetical protein